MALSELSLLLGGEYFSGDFFLLESFLARKFLAGEFFCWRVFFAGEFFAGEVFLLEGRVWEVFYRAVTALHVYIALCALYKHYTVYCTQDLHPQ